MTPATRIPDAFMDRRNPGIPHKISPPFRVGVSSCPETPEFGWWGRRA
jgi:hypothetical protein